LQQLNQPFAVGVQKTEVAGAPEALGQDMSEDQPKEFRAGQRSSPHLAGFTVLVAKKPKIIVVINFTLTPIISLFVLLFVAEQEIVKQSSVNSQQGSLDAA
jgi:hypothetical protein